VGKGYGRWEEGSRLIHYPAYFTIGSSDFEKICENCFASCSLGLAKGILLVLEKAFFFVLWCFYLFWFLCQTILKMTLLRGAIFFK
jgi:hypothetical protein